MGVFCSPKPITKIRPSISSVPSLFWWDSCLEVFILLGFKTFRFISSSYLRFSLQKNVASWNAPFGEPKGITPEIQFKELWYFPTGFVYQGKQQGAFSGELTEIDPYNNINIVYICVIKRDRQQAGTPLWNHSQQEPNTIQQEKKKISLRKDMISSHKPYLKGKRRGNS